MTKKFDRYWRLLQTERSALMGQLPAREGDWSESGPGNEEDWALFSHDRFVSGRIKDLDVEKFRHINEALERLASDDFGVCSDCGKPISAKRLDVIPWADRCVNCQERAAEQDAAGGLVIARGVSGLNSEHGGH